MINRRRQKRLIISGSATVEFERKGQIQSIQTLIANMSLRGIGLYSYSSITVETSVSITVNFISLSGGMKTDFVEGRVINIRKIGNSYLLGIHFDEEINAQNQPLLFEHLQKILPTDKVRVISLS